MDQGDWWYHVKSVICFGRIRVLSDAEEALQRLKDLGNKYFPENYGMARDLASNGPRALVLEFTPEHISGKRVREK